MPHIAIISSSVRLGRKSHRVATFFKKYIEANYNATAEIVDLMEYQFPMFDERLRLMPNPSEKILDYAGRIEKADGVLIVTPEYNGGYPAALKNAIDLLLPEWKRKPVAISTVSGGMFGGTQVITSLTFSLFKMGVLLVPAMFPVATIDKAFDEEGNPADAEGVNKRAKAFVDELFWCVDARAKMQ
ncbi:MAG: NAD(P)H-dependent oxidoreductase [Sphingobacteriales bacterium JAD_PAG50586_3]|nr:MAG: NAD(P)H-dependent oxidoreductase [Sphingobacteriales bacterium JAD_PAG50586_3]